MVHTEAHLVTKEKHMEIGDPHHFGIMYAHRSKAMHTCAHSQRHA